MQKKESRKKGKRRKKKMCLIKRGFKSAEVLDACVCVCATSADFSGISFKARRYRRRRQFYCTTKRDLDKNKFFDS